MSDDRLKIKCPCGQVLAVKRSDAGKVVACPKCKTKLRIPAQKTAPAPTQQSAPVQQSAPAQPPASAPSPLFDSAPAADDPFGDMDFGSLPDVQPTASQGMPNPYASPAPLQTSAPMNPYANPAANYAPRGASSSEDESIRNQFLSHEASLRSIGLLYFLGGFFMILMASIFLIMGLVTIPQDGAAGIASVVFALIYGGIGVGQIFVGKGIRVLKNWARITIGVLSIPGLLGIPFGTLISAYILYLCFSSKGEFVCTPRYHQIVANTPHIKYKTSAIVWVLLGIVVAMIGLGLLALVVGMLSK